MPVASGGECRPRARRRQIGADHRRPADDQQLLPAERERAADHAGADAQDDELQREQRQDLPLRRAEAAHHRRRIQVAAQIARRGQRDGDRGEDHGDQRGEAEKLLRALERLPHFGTQVADRFDALSAFEPRLRPVAKRIARVARDEQPPGRAIARLQQLRRRDVVDVHQQPGPEREQSAGDLGVLLHDRGDGQRRFADDELRSLRCTSSRAARRAVDPDLAWRAGCPCAAGPRASLGSPSSDRAAQRIAGADRLDVGEHRIATGARPAGLHHAVEPDRRHDSEPARARLARKLVRQRPVAGQQQIRAEQHIGLPRQRALDAIGEKPDGADAGDREDQRGEQHRQFAGAPVARSMTPGEA